MRRTPVSETIIHNDYTVLASDLNGYGFMHGGRLLMLADEMGFLAAHGFCRTDCLTVAVHQTRFLRSAYKGDHLILRAQVAFAGKTSLWIPVSILTEDGRLIMEAIIVYVAVDAQRIPVEVRAVTASNDAEKKVQADIIQLRSFVRSRREGEAQAHSRMSKASCREKVAG